MGKQISPAHCWHVLFLCCGLVPILLPLCAMKACRQCKRYSLHQYIYLILTSSKLIKLCCHLGYKTWEDSFLRLSFLVSESYPLPESHSCLITLHIYFLLFSYILQQRNITRRNHSNSDSQLDTTTVRRKEHTDSEATWLSSLADKEYFYAEAQKKHISFSPPKTSQTNFYSKLADWWTVLWATLTHTLSDSCSSPFDSVLFWQSQFFPYLHIQFPRIDRNVAHFITSDEHML